MAPVLRSKAPTKKTRLAPKSSRSSVNNNNNNKKKKKAKTMVETQSLDDIPGAGTSFLAMGQQDFRKYLRAKLAASGAVYRPPPPVSEEEEARVQEEHRQRLAEAGLSHLNDTPGAKYELVRPVAGAFFISDRGGIYHSNFEAKLKDDPEAKAHLFFVEFVAKVPGQLKVNRCCRLGPSGSKAAATGLNGCRVCSKINHPKNVRFITC